jgi:hypothetical protein
VVQSTISGHARARSALRSASIFSPLEASAPPLEPPITPASRRVSPVTDSMLAWILAFVITIYLALSGGGYDTVIRSQVGVLIWWLLLLGLIAGVLPTSRLAGSTWIGLVLLTGFFVWTWIAAGWTSSQEQTLIEVGRVATYIGAFLACACLLTRGSVRALLCGVAAGIAVVCALAVLSKLLPSLFPADQSARFYATPRLRYPFDYSDGVGEFAALGVPLLWYVATGARSVWARGLGAASLPVVLLCLTMTVSRGGILAAVLAVIVFLLLCPDRLPRVLSGLLAAGGTAVLILALLSRKGLTDRLFAAAPPGQRHSMLAILIVVVVVVGVLQAAIALAARRRTRAAWTVVGPGGARVTGGLIAILVAAAVVAFFATGAAHHFWEQFKQPTAASSGSSYFRLLSVAGSHRYQYWQVALHAFESSPWKGIGPGTFQFYWAQHQTLGEYVLNAHSLWLETLAELGIVGLALVGGFFIWVLVSGSVRALGEPPPERSLRVAAVAGVAAFCAAAAFDWVWQIGVIPIVAMLLCGICLSHPSGKSRPRGAGLVVKAGLAALALAALWTIVIPLASTVAIRDSQRAAGQKNFAVALRDASQAQQVEPEAASPRLQRALLLEQLRDIPAAAAAIAQAERREPTNWQIWLVGSRIATEQDRPRLALADYLRARSLNPTSPMFRS